MPRDVRLNETTGDVDLNGGFAESTENHQRDILLARPGDYSQAPTATVGIADYLDDENPDDLTRAIRIKMAQDGMKITALDVPKGILNANYPNG